MANRARDLKAVRENSKEGRQRAATMEKADIVPARTTCCRTSAQAPAPTYAAPTAQDIATSAAVTVAPWITPKLIDRVRKALLAEPSATRRSVSPPAISRGATSGSPRASAAGYAASAASADPTAPAPRAAQQAVDAQRWDTVSACTSAVPKPKSPRVIENDASVTARAATP